MRLSLVLICLLSSAYAAPKKKAQAYRFGQQWMVFYELDKGVWVAGCKKDKCEGLGIKKKLAKSTISFSSQGGKNPLSQLCENKLKGEVKIGFDKARNEQSFCFFSDGSAIKVASINEFI
jgi:hypothetical protein